jgi:hypothetical protein
MEQTQSPLITGLSWGRMTIEGVGGGKDFKLWPGGGRAWDWRETGMQHTPGIQPADVQELLENGCQAIVLSRGMLRRRDIAVHVAETKKAVEIYNDLAQRGQAVGGLFHSTC